MNSLLIFSIMIGTVHGVRLLRNLQPLQIPPRSNFYQLAVRSHFQYVIRVVDPLSELVKSALIEKKKD